MKIISRIQKRGATGQRGQVLILVVIVIAVASIIISSLMGFLSSGIKIGAHYTDRTSSLYAADAGIQDAIWQVHNPVINGQPNPRVPTGVGGSEVYYLTNNYTDTGTDIIDGWHVKVTVSFYTSYYQILSDAKSETTGLHTSITSDVSAISGTFEYAFAALGDYKLNPTSPHGDITLNNVTITPNGTGTADVLANGTLNLSGGSEVTGTAWANNITASGGTIDGNAFYVVPPLPSSSNLTIEGTAENVPQLESLPTLSDNQLNTLVSNVYTETHITVATATFGPTAGPTGTQVTITSGIGWQPNDTISGVTVGGVTATNIHLNVDPAGILSGSFTVPTGLTTGAQNIIIIGVNSGAQVFTNAFTIGTATAIATCSPISGPAGTKVTVNGSGWPVNEIISGVTVGGKSATNNLSIDVTTGSLSGSFTVLSSAANNDTVVITGSPISQTFPGEFTVTPIGTTSGASEYRAAQYISPNLALSGNNVTFDNAVYVTGNISINGSAQNITFNGPVYAGGNISLSGNGSSASSCTFNGPVRDSGDFTCNNLSLSFGPVSGTTINSTLFVGGNFSYTSTISFSGNANLTLNHDMYVNGSFASSNYNGAIVGGVNVVVRGSGSSPAVNLFEIALSGGVLTSELPFFIVPPHAILPAVSSDPTSVQIQGFILSNDVYALLYAPTCNFSNSGNWLTTYFYGAAICKSINFTNCNLSYPSDLSTRPTLPYVMVGGSGSGGMPMTTYVIGQVLGPGATTNATFTPNYGPDGTKTIVSGSGWQPNENISGVTVGSLTATYNLTVDNNGNLTGYIIVPLSLDTGPVTIVITGKKSGAQTFPDSFTIAGASPTIASISPNISALGGGTLVTIVGTNFATGATVTIGGNLAINVHVTNAYTLTATTPAGTDGAQDVVVTTAGGSGTLVGGYTYIAPPTVTGISPNTGSTNGGTSVTITGTDFIGVTAVKFGSNNASSFTVNSSTKITVTSPAQSAGIQDIMVTTPYGTSTASSADQFTYQAPPTVTSVSPNSGSTNGGTSVTITGTNFTGATAVKFGSNNASSFTVNSSTKITATSPAHNAATQDITVTTPYGTSTTGSADRFTYVAAPTVTGISPSFGLVTGGTSVIITGTNFTAVTAVNFGSTAAASYTVNNSTKITAISPAGSDIVDVTVTIPVGGVSATSSSDRFTYVPPPTVTSISPSSGPLAGGTSVIITGAGFYGGGSSSTVTAVKFGTTTATYTVNSDTQITATSPVHIVGTVDVTVTTSNGGGTSATSPLDKFTYIAVPTVTGISPSAGPLAGGTIVTITGTNFTGATGVKFGSNNASGFTVNSATQITATSPANSAGTVDITVTTTLGTNTTSSADKFTYVEAPTVTGISPSSGSTTGGTSVTITGTHFTGATGVKFGSNNATNISITSDTNITVTAPAGSAGAVNVIVTTPGGNGTGSYTYVAPTTAGPNNARTGADGGGSGSSWSSPGNITAPGTPYATSSLSSRGGSHYLYGTNYGFNIPAGATITGIQVTIMRQSSSSNSLTDNVVQLLKGGNRVGSDYSSSTSWPTSMTAASYGGSSDLWGTTWTVNDINATNFGVALSVSNGSFSGRTASVDYMQITVYYTP